MAKAASRKSDDKKKTAASEVVKAGSTAVALSGNIDLEALGARGMEEVDAESFATPFFMVLQTGSPQANEAKAEYVDGAKAGMLYESVSNRLWDGKTGTLITFCHFRRVFIRWGNRKAGGGFKGEFTVEQATAMREKGEVKELDGKLFFPMPDGSINPDKSDVFNDTRNHYVILTNEDQTETTPAVFSLTSTQIKKSKSIMSALNNVRFDGKNGKYQPPTFASVVRVKTLPESNDQGDWFGVNLQIAGKVTRNELLEAGFKFYELANRQEVTVKYAAGGGESGPEQRRGF